MGKSTQITGASLMNQHQMRCQPSDPEPASLVNRGRQDVVGGGAHIIIFNVREIGPQRPQSPPAVSLSLRNSMCKFLYIGLLEMGPTDVFRL